MREAMFYKKLPQETVQCELCPHFCTIPEGGRGNCGVRENINGELYSLVYGKAISMAVDPVEKKPLFHFAPGTKCLSIATVGCNLHCSFCQNWEISQPQSVSGRDVSPESVVKMAKSNGVPGIAYTYTEPTVFFEYALDIMKLAREEGLYNIWVSNGYTNPEPARMAAKYMDAINVDMKGDVRFYKKFCGVPNEKSVKEALLAYHRAGVWVEVTNLVIPGFNDRKLQVERLSKWVATNLGKDTPLHFSRFHPEYKLSDTEQTPQKTLEMCHRTARKNLRWVYVGNVWGHDGESTKCPKCGKNLIERRGFNMLAFKYKCDKCDIEVPISGKEWIKLRGNHK